MSGDRYKTDDQNGLYFLTFTVIDWVDVFTRKEYCYDISNSFKYCQKNMGLVIYAWCGSVYKSAKGQWGNIF